MRSRLVKVQLVIFAIVSVLAVFNAVYSYMGAQRYTGIGLYTVQVEMEEAGGLYVNSLVTYRGVDIGVVTGLDVDPQRATARLQLRSGIDVPEDSDAFIRSVSAVGEQYLDLVPATSEPPFLQEGSVIAAHRVSTPTPSAEVVEEVHTLLEGVPKDELRTTVDEAFTAFDGLGPELGVLIESSRPLIALAQAEIRPTEQLIRDAEPVLDEFNASGSAVMRFSSDLASFSEQLVLNDDQIRAALDDGPGFFSAVNDTLASLESPLPILLANLQSVGEVTRVNVPGLRHLLVVYPATSASINYMHQGYQGDEWVYGQAPLDVKLGNSANPLPCTEGYETQRRDPSDVSPAEPVASPYCRLPHEDQRVSRGARNVPCATDPTVRTAEVGQCPGGLPSTWPQMLARPGSPYVPSPGPEPVSSPVTERSVAGAEHAAAPQRAEPARYSGPTVDEEMVPYDPATGRFRTADGTTYQLGNITHPSKEQEPLSWKNLFTR